MYETEIPENMTMNSATAACMAVFKELGVVIFERDDSPEGYETMKQLKEIAGAVGYWFVCSGRVASMVADHNKVYVTW